MIESWIIAKLDPLRPATPIIVRDPLRMLQHGARAVHGWAEENGYTVLFCTGNLALREMWEAMRDDPGARVLLVDRSRADAPRPLFYPDLAAAAGLRRQITLSLRAYLIEQTGDPNWPPLTDDRLLAPSLLANLSGVIEAHRQLREVVVGRFTDGDLYWILLAAALKINPFHMRPGTSRPEITAAEVRRVCLEAHDVIGELGRVLPAEVMATLRDAIASAPKPFCWLLDRDPKQVLCAFTLAAIMHQHGLEYSILLPNLDPALYDYRDIAPAFLDQALADQLKADPDQVADDVAAAEEFLKERPARLAFLLRDRLGLDDPERALTALRRERLSPLIRGLALVSLLLDLIESRRLKYHEQVIALLDAATQDPTLPAAARPPGWWSPLETAYRRAYALYGLTDRLVGHVHKLKVAAAEALDFATFDRLWREERLNRLEFYASDLERMLRIGEMLPVPQAAFWPELATRWAAGREAMRETVKAIEQALALVNTRFQDLYAQHYATWIRRPDGPVIFTHQFLPRLLRMHWDPHGGRKAVIMIFDGLRTDAWEELLRPVFEERFAVIESRPGSALIPTETQLSRKAIAAGRLPAEFNATRELELLRSWLKTHMNLTPAFEVVVDDDSIAAGISVRYTSAELDYIVFSFTDANLHHNTQDLAFIYNVTVREIIRQDVRSVLRELPANALLFVTGDHGFAAVPDGVIPVPADIIADEREVRYLAARVRRLPPAEDACRVVAFDAAALGLPGRRDDLVLFPRPGYTFGRPGSRHAPDRYSHGGLSLAECFVPMVVLGPRTAPQPPVEIESLRQTGSMREGEPLTLEITVVPRRSDLSDLMLHFTFSPDDISPRRELFSGKSATYLVRWMPHLADVRDEDRRRGVVVRPVTVNLTYRHEGRDYRLSRTVEMQIKLDPARLRRRVDSKLDLLMGKTPRGLE